MVIALVKLDVVSETIAHELNIPIDGLAIPFKLSRKDRAVDFARLDSCQALHHPLDHWSAV